MSEETVDNIDPVAQAWIDAASYEALLRRWRFAPLGGDPYLQGATGQYYGEVMAEKKSNHPDPVAVSKLIGWANE